MLAQAVPKRGLQTMTGDQTRVNTQAAIYTSILEPFTLIFSGICEWLCLLDRSSWHGNQSCLSNVASQFPWRNPMEWRWLNSCYHYISICIDSFEVFFFPSIFIDHVFRGDVFWFRRKVCFVSHTALNCTAFVVTKSWRQLPVLILCKNCFQYINAGPWVRVWQRTTRPVQLRSRKAHHALTKLTLGEGFTEHKAKNLCKII